MNLRNRTLLIIGLAFFVLFIVLTGVLFGITQAGLHEIEFTDMKEATAQVTASFNGESRALLATAQDWGWWDETAAFVANNDSEYLDRNINSESLSVIGVNLFLVLDARGEPVYSRLYTPDFSSYGGIPADVLAGIRATPGLVSDNPEDPGIAGFFSLPEGPALLAATPVLLSDRSGPVRGTIVMGRYIGSGSIHEIETVTGYGVRITGGDQPVPAPDGTGDVRTRLAGAALVLVPDAGNTVTAYSTVRDITGGDLVLAVSMPRDLYNVGFGTLTLTIVLLVLWAAITALVVAAVLDHTVLQRIERLTEQVRAHPGTQDTIPAPVLNGNDELAALEQTILASRADLQMSECQLRVFINALPDPAALYARDGKILLANAAFAAAVSRPAGELVGTPVWDHFPWDRMENYLQQAEEAIRTRAVVQYEQESGGKTLLITHYPVLDPEGEVVQVGLLTFDISERKRLENALRRVTKKIALLNTVIFTDIQNKVFVQRGYQELLREEAAGTRIREYLDKEAEAVKEIQSSLAFARLYNDMGANPPRWQNVNEVMAFAVSHADLGTIRREFRLEGLEIYADPLLERVFSSIVENVVRHATNATLVRARYSVTGDGALIVIEDDGPGIPDGAKEKIFGKGAGSGGAVGLFLSREILSITGITIRETGVPGSGARFELLVPDGSFRVSLSDTDIR
jgi:PAS domain S-box-containing protein